MVIHITPETKCQALVEATHQLPQGKRLDAKKICGAVKWQQDALEAQQKMRNEWT